MNHKGTITLETGRLILRRYTEEDVPMIYKNYLGDRNIVENLVWKARDNEEETREFVKRCIEKYKSNEIYNWLVVIKDTKEIIGSVVVVSKNNDHGVCELGYNFGSKYWGHGYATEAVHRVCRFLLKDVGYRLIDGCFSSNNAASGRVMEKVGMKKDGVLRDRRVDKRNGKLYDLVYYSMTEDDLD